MITVDKFIQSDSVQNLDLTPEVLEEMLVRARRGKEKDKPTINERLSKANTHIGHAYRAQACSDADSAFRAEVKAAIHELQSTLEDY